MKSKKIEVGSSSFGLFSNSILSWYQIKYLLQDVLFPFFLGTIVFILIMLLFQAIRLSEFVITQQVSFFDLMDIVYSLFLSFLPLAIPVAFLFSVLLAVSRANSEGEIIGLLACGVRLRQVFLPLFFFSFFISFLCLYLSLFIVPKANRNFEVLITRLGSERIISQLKPGVFHRGFFGLVLYAEKVISIKNEMKRIFLYDSREAKRPVMITAEEGVLKVLPEKGVVTLRLTRGAIFSHARKKTDPRQRIHFDIYDINLDLGEKVNAYREYSPPSYTYAQLQQKLVETSFDPPTHRELKIEFHRRFSLSFSCVVFSALGFFSGMIGRKSGRHTAIILCLVVGLSYWLFYLVANAVVVKNGFPPWLMLWLPNFLFLGVAYFLRSVRR